MKRKSRFHSHGDFELPLASIVDCFTVLVAFMLISSSFLAIGVFEADSPTQAQATDQAPKEVVQVEIKLLGLVDGKSKGFSVTVMKGDSKKSQEIGADLESLKAELARLKSTHPSLEGFILSSDSETPYEEYIRVMDTVRAVHPAILVGGI